jgi:IS605 OrfB family transposase
MTGLSENNAILIGSNVNLIIRKQIKILNKIKSNKNISSKIKKKNEKIINRKIHNKIDDLHWKTINYLINNYNNILLGDMSAKSIVSKKSKVLSGESKVACLRTRYYDFRQRLKYKCDLTRTNFRLVNECYTSKICSLCGNYNDKLKGESRYKCIYCENDINRDINGCRNIMIKSKMN